MYNSIIIIIIIIAFTNRFLIIVHYLFIATITILHNTSTE